MNMLLNWLAALALPALGAGQPALSVFDLHRQHGKLTGHAVDVTGWLSSCSQFSCALHESREGAAGAQSSSYLISIGGGDGRIESALKAAALRKVVLRARVTRNCWYPNQCLDRGDSLIPISVKVLPETKEKR